MSRAFMKENDGMFHCNRRDRDCPDANLRGGCELEHCRHEDKFADIKAEADECKDEKVH
ncbi:MAG: hypothetical protein Q4E54_02995 [Lachnospiraceae bacterium]|nr:hypothetical protein [Lachnospiraceae bacterium]